MTEQIMGYLLISKFAERAKREGNTKQLALIESVLDKMISARFKELFDIRRAY